MLANLKERSQKLLRLVRCDTYPATASSELSRSSLLACSLEPPSSMFKFYQYLCFTISPRYISQLCGNSPGVGDHDGPGGRFLSAHRLPRILIESSPTALNLPRAHRRITHCTAYLTTTSQPGALLPAKGCSLLEPRKWLAASFNSIFSLGFLRLSANPSD